MRYIIKFLVVLACMIAVVTPAAAIITNVSPGGTDVISNSYKHDPNYMLWEYECILIAIGLVCLAISRIWESTEDIFSIIAVIPLAMSAWFANFMAMEKTTTVVAAGTITIVNTQIITPNPYLSAVMLIAMFCGIANVIWVFFMKEADKATSGSNEQQQQ